MEIHEKEKKVKKEIPIPPIYIKSRRRVIMHQQNKKIIGYFFLIIIRMRDYILGYTFIEASKRIFFLNILL